jgi:hypothetical protein
LVTRRAMCSIGGVTAVMILQRPVSSPSFRLQNGCVMSMKPVPLPEPDPQVAGLVRSMYGGSRRKVPPLAVAVRDKLAVAYGRDGFAPRRAGPSVVTVRPRKGKPEKILK